jgi:hypothetical protein
MLRKATCIMGGSCGTVLPRRKIYPPSCPAGFALALIQDFGSVMLLDDEDHHWRKAMFLSLITPGSMTRLIESTAKHWRDCIK